MQDLHKPVANEAKTYKKCFQNKERQSPFAGIVSFFKAKIDANPKTKRHCNTDNKN